MTASALIPSDTTLLGRARDGDASAFGELMSRHHAPLFHVARAIVRSSEDAQDVTQTAWFHVHQHVRQFAGSSSVRTWLIAITRNAAIDHRRVTLRQPWQWSQNAASMIDTHCSTLPSPEELLLEKERQARLTQSIAALPSHLRAPLRLWHSQQYSYAEMANKTGVVVGTIKSRIWEARRHVIVSCRLR
jgi:RNA polymerase sigma-70 factor (ECF subfamily)